MKHFLVHDVERHIGSGTLQELILLAKVGCHHAAVSVYLAKRKREFHADLTRGADYQDLFFDHLIELECMRESCRQK
jgi:hypothetical protein